MSLEEFSASENVPAAWFNEVKTRLAQTQVQGRRINPTHEDYGAKGDGTADDTQAIKDAVADLRTFGGGILELTGDFLVNDQIVLQDGPNAEPILVTGHASGPTNSSATNPSRLLVNHDGDGFVSRGIGGTFIEHLTVEDNLSAGDRTQGAGILLSRASGDDGNVTYHIDDVLVNGFRDGIRAVRGVASTIETARVDNPERDGIRLESTSGGSGTSTTIKNCFVRSAGQDGYSVGGHTYIQFQGCSSDQASRHGYRTYKDQNVNPAGHSYIACGSEKVTSDGIHATDSLTALLITGGLHTEAGDDGIHVDANGCLVSGVKLTGNAGYGINNAGSDTITEIGCNFINNTSGQINGSAHRLGPTGNTNRFTLADGGDLDVGTGDIRLAEGDKPSGRGADEAHLYLEDDGSGNTRLVIRWGDDVDTVIATQP